LLAMSLAYVASLGQAQVTLHGEGSPGSRPLRTVPRFYAQLTACGQTPVTPRIRPTSRALSRPLSTLCASASAASVWQCRRRNQARKATGSASGSSPLNLGNAKQGVKEKTEAESSDSGSWVLPSVDKDVGEYYAGRAPNYAWVQTSETLYLFTRLPEVEAEAEADGPNVTLELQQEGTIVRLIVHGNAILNGRLAHQIKPGEQIWMVEEAADGKDYVVCELDKLTPGINWASVMEPEVEATADYSHAVVEMPEILSEEEEKLVGETIEHLQKSHRILAPVEGRAAAFGDVLTVDMQGYELQSDGSRGEPLEIGSATGLEVELGAGGLSRKVEASLEGIAVGETRDVEVTLGQRAGGLGGTAIICAVTCQELKEQQLPELTDDFAQMIKRQDLFKQAGTAEGIPEEEEGSAEKFTLADLRAEITQEVRQVAQTQSNTNVDTQLQSHLRQKIKVTCNWADLGSQEAVLDEELAVRARFVAEREGLMPLIDMDAVDRQAWDKLGEPDEGESLKQVGKDPAREYQDAHRTVLRETTMNEVLHWLRQNMELVEADEGQ